MKQIKSDYANNYFIEKKNKEVPQKINLNSNTDTLKNNRYSIADQTSSKQSNINRNNLNNLINDNIDIPQDKELLNNKQNTKINYINYDYNNNKQRLLHLQREQINYFNNNFETDKNDILNTDYDCN